MSATLMSKISKRIDFHMEAEGSAAIIEEDIVIAGGGVAGLATALGLHRKGIRSLVLESSPTLRASGFALTIWTNAWRALDALGVGDRLREQHVLNEGFRIFTGADNGFEPPRQTFGLQGKLGLHEIRCVKRKLLLQALADELPTGTIRCSSKVVSIEEDGNFKLLRLADSSVIKAKVVIGCDGVNSAIAKWLGLKKPTDSHRYAVRGLSEYEHGHPFERDFFQIAANGFRVGFLPCSTTSVYWFFTWTPSDKDGDTDSSKEKMRDFILSKLRDVKAPEGMIGAVEKSQLDEVLSSPLKFRSPISIVLGNITKGNVCVLGDAFHPMTPDLGQGGCSALEDSVVLARCLSQAILRNRNRNKNDGDDDEEQRFIREGLEKYAEARRWRCAKLVATAFLVGYIMQSENPFIGLLRSSFFGRNVRNILLSMADYDCGGL